MHDVYRLQIKPYNYILSKSSALHPQIDYRSLMLHAYIIQY